MDLPQKKKENPMHTEGRIRHEKTTPLATLTHGLTRYDSLQRGREGTEETRHGERRKREAKGKYDDGRNTTTLPISKKKRRISREKKVKFT